MKLQAIQDIVSAYYAIATVADDGAVTYGTPKKIYDLQKVKLSVTTSSDKHYTSDGVDAIINFEDGTLDIDTYGIEQSILNEMEGITVDGNGVTNDNTSDEAPYLAIGYEFIKRNLKSKFTWLPLCKKKAEGEEAEVKKQKIEPKGTVLSFDVFERKDGNWRSRVSEDDIGVDPVKLKANWFTAVYEKDVTWA